jgi:hypothetical protein
MPEATASLACGILLKDFMIFAWESCGAIKETKSVIEIAAKKNAFIFIFFITYIRIVGIISSFMAVKQSLTEQLLIYYILYRFYPVN